MIHKEKLYASMAKLSNSSAAVRKAFYCMDQKEFEQYTKIRKWYCAISEHLNLLYARK